MIGALPPFIVNSRPLKKTKWTREEDDQLRRVIQAFGTESWNRVSRWIPGRTGKQCRERWIGQIAPSVSKEGWLPHEDAILICAHGAAGNKWSVIATQIPGRSPISVKNRWRWLIRHRNRVGRVAPAVPDVLETPRPCQMVFESLIMDNGLFGTAFREFQAKMFMGN
jgi:hypothetical protein